VIEILVDVALFSYPLAHLMILVVAWTFVLSGLEDAYFDLHYWGRSIWRAWMRRRQGWQRLTLERLLACEQKKIAILVPAWDESAVIGRMLRNACRSLLYHNYDIFVGVYPNDPATQAAVDAVSRDYPQVHKVVSPTPGPSTKAENLNHMYRYLAEYERRSGQRYALFDIVVGHDSEDVIHPLSLLVYNYLVPRKDMIQLPVFPLPFPWHFFTHWTYADEFAENHTRIMAAREYSQGFVPSAGVGTAYTRRAMELVSMRYGGEIFSPVSLTEDYELGLRMHLEGVRGAFVAQRVDMPTDLRSRFQGSPRMSRWIATQAMFPTSLHRAIRQKTRWNLGIILQGWTNVGWKGRPGIIMNLIHDRKPVITSLMSFLAYPILLYWVAYTLLKELAAFELPPLVHSGTLLSYLIGIATGFMVWRMAQRALAVTWVYGIGPGLMSIVRSPWANLINFVAMVRAIDQYVGKRFILHEPIAWDKTAHEFPEADSSTDDLATPVKPIQPETTDPVEIERRVATFREAIRSQDAEERRSAIRRLGRADLAAALPWLLELINDPAWQVRGELCRALGFARLHEGIPCLEQAASDPDWTVRTNAVVALSKLGDAGEEALLRILQRDDRYAREVALATLEQEGFLERNLARYAAGGDELKRAQRFFVLLEQYGPSELAREMLKSGTWAVLPTYPVLQRDAVEVVVGDGHR
jgi:adsorption protein B